MRRWVLIGNTSNAHVDSQTKSNQMSECQWLTMTIWTFESDTHLSTITHTNTTATHSRQQYFFPIVYGTWKDINKTLCEGIPSRWPTSPDLHLFLIHSNSIGSGQVGQRYRFHSLHQTRCVCTQTGILFFITADRRRSVLVGWKFLNPTIRYEQELAGQPAPSVLPSIFLQLSMLGRKRQSKANYRNCGLWELLLRQLMVMYQELYQFGPFFNFPVPAHHRLCRSNCTGDGFFFFFNSLWQCIIPRAM